jgi:O-antigen/teichoic acid export membrane protein
MPGKNKINMIGSLFERIPWLASLDPHFSEMAQNSTVNFLIRAFGALLSIGFNVMIARLLGAEGTGIFFLAMTVTVTASVLGQLGLNIASLRFIAASDALGETDKVAGIFRLAVRFCAVASSVVAIAVYFAAPVIAVYVFSEPNLIEPLRLMAFGIMPLSLFSLSVESLRGLKKIGAAALVESVSVPLISICLSGILLMLAGSVNVTDVTAIIVIAMFITLGLAVVLWRHATPHLRRRKGSFDLGLLVKTSIPLLWVSLVGLVMAYTGTVALGAMKGSEAVGVYNIVAGLSVMSAFGLSIINSVIAPQFAALSVKKDHEALDSLVRRATCTMTVIAIPIQALFILAPSWTLSFFGQEFTVGANALVILTLGQFVNVATGSTGNLLVMSGHEKLARNNDASCAALNVVLAVILIPEYGIIGAAVAMAVSLAVKNVAGVVLVYKKLSILTVPIPARFTRK